MISENSPCGGFKSEIIIFYPLFIKESINNYYLIIMLIFIILWHKIDNKMVVSYYSLVILMISTCTQIEILHCFPPFLKKKIEIS